MPYYVRLMHWGDIAQVTEIDREAFLGLMPSPNYRNELKNRMTHYVVVCDDARLAEPSTIVIAPDKGISGLLYRVKHMFERDKEVPASTEYIVGFAGFWNVVDEAHLISIAVREEYRRRGIGELLLISIIDLAIELDVRLVTLEVRASNITALGLYRKFGFIQVGLRGGYYTDNNEDAALMTLENVNSELVRSSFKELKKSHSGKMGRQKLKLARSGRRRGA